MGNFYTETSRNHLHNLSEKICQQRQKEESRSDVSVQLGPSNFNSAFVNSMKQDVMLVQRHYPRLGSFYVRTFPPLNMHHIHDRNSILRRSKSTWVIWRGPRLQNYVQYNYDAIRLSYHFNNVIVLAWPVIPLPNFVDCFLRTKISSCSVAILTLVHNPSSAVSR